MALEDREKKAFSKLWGLFEFCRMSFGLYRAVATFQCRMDKVLNLHQRCTPVCIDNIIIFLPSWQQHLQDIQAVFQDNRGSGMTANPNGAGGN